MNNCDVCGKKEVLPYKCSYCGGTFCSDHRLPEQHNCSFDKDYWNVPVKVKKEKKAPVKVPISTPKLNKSQFSLPLKGITAYGYNNIILGICTVLFFMSIIFRPVEYYLALFPGNVFIMPWQLVTSIFLHSSFSHYLVNMIVLLFFGGELERRVGGKIYIQIFLLSGLSGNLAYLAFAYSTGHLIPALGASGAIYGIMGTLAIIAPEIRVLFFFFLPMSIRMAILIFAAWDIFMLPYSLQTGIAHIAHLAGLFIGLYYGKKVRIVRKWRMW